GAHVQLLHRSNGRTAEADLDAVAAGLQDEGILLDGGHTADHATDGGDLVADLDGITHGSIFLVLTLLRQVDDQIHEHDEDDHGKDKADTAARRGSFHKLNHNDCSLLRGSRPALRFFQI